MADWKLNLTQDRLKITHPFYFSLEERIAGYRNYYLSPGRGEVSMELPQTVGTMSSDSPHPLSAPDDRKTETPFSALFCLYSEHGDEFTFSRRGMRHMIRPIPWQGHYHTHDYIEILYVAEGSFEQILLGEHQSFCAGEFVITDRNLSHADYLAQGAGASVLFLSLQSDYLDQLLSSCDRRDDLQRFFFHTLQRQRKEQSYLHLHPSERDPVTSAPALSRLLETLIAEDWSPSEGSEEIIRGNLIRLFSILCRDYSMQLHSSDRESKEKAFLYELERYIRLHAGQVTSRELEQVFHYHRNYFNLILKKYQEITFQEYVTKIRLEHAASLLAQTRLSVREVAAQSGWHNSSHFYHLFEISYGMSPSDYRKQTVTGSDLRP